jgi:hypothetical protein
MAQTPWDILRQGNKQEAFDLFCKRGDRDQPSHIMELGVAYLWAQEYQAAWEHFDAANRRQPKYMDIFYGMAGAAKWCLCEMEAAVAQWRIGVRCRYADGAGGMGSPLLLFFASVVEPRLFERTEAEKLISKRADNPSRVRNWPGPVGQFVLGRINAGVLLAKMAESKSKDASDLLLVEFYIGVLARARGDMQDFERQMQKAAATSDDDFDVNNRQYLAKLWCPAFFLARYEASK